MHTPLTAAGKPPLFVASAPVDYGGKALGSLSSRASHQDARSALVRCDDAAVRLVRDGCRYVVSSLGWVPFLQSHVATSPFEAMTTLFREDPTLPRAEL